MIRLSEIDIDEELKNLSGWSVINEKLHKEFQFDNFNQAFGFVYQRRPIISPKPNFVAGLKVYEKIINQTDKKWSNTLPMHLRVRELHQIELSQVKSCDNKNSRDQPIDNL